MKTTAARCLAVALALAGVLTPSHVRATIYTLNPGATITAASSSDPVGGLLLASVTSPFALGALSGTLVTDVFSQDASNPFPGGLTFTYSLSISSSSTDSSSEMTVNSFAGFHTEVSYNLTGSEIAPAFFSRNSLGDTVRATFLPNTIGPGQEGALVVVQTDALHFIATTAGVIDGTTVNVPSLAPAPVPEPAAASLLLLGAGTLFVTRRKRS